MLRDEIIWAEATSPDPIHLADRVFHAVTTNDYRRAHPRQTWPQNRFLEPCRRAYGIILITPLHHCIRSARPQIEGLWR